MLKSLRLQAEMMQEFGTCVFDVTLDCEDGAPVGGEHEHASMVSELAQQACEEGDAHVGRRRLGVRVHPVGHPAFGSDVETIVGRAANALCYLMIPKVESVADVEVAADAAARALAGAGAKSKHLPLHVLIESPAALAQVFEIARHPRVESLSFGLMDFVSAHAGAIDDRAMTVRRAGDDLTLDQFHHPLVRRAKLEIASACHAYGKVPSHCVVTEIADTGAVREAAALAAHAFGYTRMWSIHPNQIRPILAAFSPSADQVENAAEIITRAAAQDWAPLSVQGRLHDRASFRYFWQVLERAHRTGRMLPESVQGFFENNHRLH
jgi:citrate lyase subunit beta/citryl-CoA lyase